MSVPLDPRGGNARKRRRARFVANVNPCGGSWSVGWRQNACSPRDDGYAADYVKNIQKEPRVRVKVGRRWLEGTARLLPEDDVDARLQSLGRPVNDALVRMAGTQLLTVRIDLDDR